MDLLGYERELLHKGYCKICGIDEAGRGPLAGPVVVGGVIMPLDSKDIIEGVNDSKKLSEKKRNELYDKIIDKAIAWHVSVISEQIIDEINILNATKMGMRECIDNLAISDIALVDAVKLNVKIPTVPIIHGDALSYSIAAASILAKVTRDRIMCELDEKYPLYQFKKHKGYGTALHIGLLKQHGPCEIHRQSFIKKILANEQ
ncbi:MAG: ribonuclease HII [Corallococcus sp.]|nr:ribonuclease HII [Corallococcus sp.]